jgi:hypothetical protein
MGPCVIDEPWQTKRGLGAGRSGAQIATLGTLTLSILSHCSRDTSLLCIVRSDSRSFVLLANHMVLSPRVDIAGMMIAGCKMTS